MTVVCLVLLLLALIGSVVDDRTILGAPAMLKPAKFGASGAVYLFTLAFMIRDLPRSRTLRVAATLIAWIIVLETVLIFVQAGRGVSSHFNVNTPLDIAIFSAMGMGIATVWILSMLILILHLRTPTVDRAMGTALRIGLALNILGAGVGWRMTQPSAEQIAAAKPVFEPTEQPQADRRNDLRKRPQHDPLQPPASRLNDAASAPPHTKASASPNLICLLYTSPSPRD